MNIWNGLRYKVFIDWNRQVNKLKFSDGPIHLQSGLRRVLLSLSILRDFIWAGRAAGDFSWGNQNSFIISVRGWMADVWKQRQIKRQERYLIHQQRMPTDYGLSKPGRKHEGLIQNIANGNNAVVINSEFRLPRYSVLSSKNHQ